MPIHYLIKRQANAVFVKIVGDVSTPNVLESMRNLNDEPALPDSPRVLIDATHQTKARSANDAEQVASQYQSLYKIKTGRIAIVATLDVVYGVARMVSIQSEMSDIEIQVFREMNDALDYLGLTGLPDSKEWDENGIESVS